MASFLLTLKKNLMDAVLERIQAGNYYVFASKHTPWTNELTPDTETPDVNSAEYEVKREMMLGKKIKTSDFTYLLDKVTWASNTIYAQYDHRDSQLYTKQYYVINTANNVYKCLFNNNNARSTIEPTATSNTPFTLGDSYTWKYMYSISSANATKFATSIYAPIDISANVQSSAANGAIDIILIENGGTGYKSTSGVVQEVVSSTIFKIDPNNASNINDYYNDSGFYIQTGSGVGSLTVISDYVANATGRYVITADALPSVDLTSSYLISPQIRVSGDGTGAKAYCTLNSNTGAVSTVRVLARGLNYSYADVSAVANPLYGSGAELVAILPPPGGHGANQPAELNSNKFAVSVDLSNTEFNTIPSQVEFRQVGMIYAPKNLSNTSNYTGNTFNSTLRLTYTSAGGSPFTKNEQVDGLTSSAKGWVAFSNSTVVMLTSVTGSFANSENIIGRTSSKVGTVTAINNPDINRFTGEVLYYDNVSPVQRTNTSVETIRLIVKF